MPKKLKFSIVTPSYNQANTLVQTIESVLNQDYPYYEYFVYDNCSTDGSDIIIKKYPRLKYQIKKDQGQPDALNQGFRKADGDIFAFINSDDYYLPNTFTKVAKYFTDHPDCQWLVGGCQVIGKPLAWTFWLKQIVPYHLYPSFLYLFNFINQPAVFIRRNLFMNTGFFDINLHYCFDYDYWLRLIKTFPPHRLYEPLAVFRITNNSKGSTLYRKQFTEDLLVVKKYTQNKLFLFIHSLLDYLIISIYRYLK